MAHRTEMGGEPDGGRMPGMNSPLPHRTSRRDNNAIMKILPEWRSRTDRMRWRTAIEAPDPSGLARFHAVLLGWHIGHEEPGTAIVATAGSPCRHSATPGDSTRGTTAGSRDAAPRLRQPALNMLRLPTHDRSPSCVHVDTRRSLLACGLSTSHCRNDGDMRRDTVDPIRTPVARAPRRPRRRRHGPQWSNRRPNRPVRHPVAWCSRSPLLDSSSEESGRDQRMTGAGLVRPARRALIRCRRCRRVRPGSHGPARRLLWVRGDRRWRT